MLKHIKRMDNFVLQFNKTFIEYFHASLHVNITEFDDTSSKRKVKRFKTRFNPPFSTFENAYSKSGI